MNLLKAKQGLETPTTPLRIIVWASKWRSVGRSGYVVDYSIREPVYERKTWFVETDAYHAAVLTACVAARDRIVMHPNCGGLGIETKQRYVTFIADTPDDTSFQKWKIDRLCVLNNSGQFLGGYLYSHVKKMARRNRKRINIFKRMFNPKSQQEAG